MCCCGEDSVQVSKMALELKSGPMLWHKRRFIGSNWRDVHSVLYNDSSLLWYQDKSRQEQKGGVILKEAPELIAFGPYTSQVPDRPPLPDNYEPKELMAFGVRGKDVVYWLLCPNEEEVASWMSAIATTLPPPPMPPQAQHPAMNQSQLPPPQPSSMDNPAYQQQPHQSAPQYTPQQPPPQYTPMHQQQQPSYAPQPPPGIPGQYPQPTNYRPPPYLSNNAVHPQPYVSNNAVHPQPYPMAAGGGGGPATIVVQQDRPGNTGLLGGGAGSFAMGAILGGAIGTAWGSHHNHGFGGGWGGGGGWGHGPSQNDTNVNITNYYDNDTTTVNNNLDMTNNQSVGQETATPAQADPLPQEHAPMQDMVTPPPQAVPLPQEYAPMQESVEYLPVAETAEYIPVEDVGGDYDGGDYGDYGGGDYGGDYGGDFGGGDFGDF